MAGGYVGDRTWDEISDVAARRIGKLLEFIDLGEVLYADMLAIYAHYDTGGGTADDDVAVGLFGNSDPENLQRVEDWKAALQACHDIHDVVHQAANYDVLRKLTGPGSS